MILPEYFAPPAEAPFHLHCIAVWPKQDFLQEQQPEESIAFIFYSIPAFCLFGVLFVTFFSPGMSIWLSFVVSVFLLRSETSSQGSALRKPGSVEDGYNGCFTAVSTPRSSQFWTQLVLFALQNVSHFLFLHVLVHFDCITDAEKVKLQGF